MLAEWQGSFVAWYLSPPFSFAWFTIGAKNCNWLMVYDRTTLLNFTNGLSDRITAARDFVWLLQFSRNQKWKHPRKTFKKFVLKWSTSFRAFKSPPNWKTVTRWNRTLILLDWDINLFPCAGGYSERCNWPSPRMQKTQRSFHHCEFRSPRSRQHQVIYF